jgi:CheY-specific phosphatase CheX
MDCLDESIRSTFTAILGESPSLSGNISDPLSIPGMVGIIAVIGDISWSVSLGFSPQTATRMALRFAKFEIPYDSRDMGDIIGELANVLAGDLVARLEQSGIRVDMSLPTVARVEDLRVLQPGAAESLRFTYSSSEGEFFVGLAVGRPLGQFGRTE